MASAAERGNGSLSEGQVPPTNYFDMVESVLRAQLQGKPPHVRQAVMRAVQREHMEMIKALALDEIEAMATEVPRNQNRERGSRSS